MRHAPWPGHPPRNGRGRSPERRYPSAPCRDVFDILTSDGFEQVAYCHDRSTGPPGHRRHPLHRAGPGAGRHPLLPLRLRGGGAGRRVPPRQGHDLQARRLRQRLRRRQGRDHRRPPHPAQRGAAAGLRPVHRGPQRPLPHRRGRRAPPRPTWTSSAARPATSPASASRWAARATRPPPPPSACCGRCGRSAERLWGSPSLAGRHVVVSGVGKVGVRPRRPTSTPRGPSSPWPTSTRPGSGPWPSATAR